MLMRPISQVLRTPLNFGNRGGPQPFAQPVMNQPSIPLPPQVEDFYVYATTPVNLAAAATSNQSFQIQADSDFEWVQSTVFAFVHAATAPLPDNISIPVYVTIADSGSGRQLFLVPLPVSSLFGNGKQPFILPISRTFQARAAVQVTLQNNGADQYDNVQLLFIGRKIFHMSPGQLRG